VTIGQLIVVVHTHYNLKLLTSGHFTGGLDEVVMKWWWSGHGQIGTRYCISNM